MSQASRAAAVRFFGVKDVGFGAQQTSQKVWQSQFGSGEPVSTPSANRAALPDKSGDANDDSEQPRRSAMNPASALQSTQMHYYGTIANPPSMRVLQPAARAQQKPATLLDPWLPAREQALWEHVLWSGAVAADAQLLSPFAQPPPPPPAPSGPPADQQLQIEDLSGTLTALALPEHLLDSDSEGPSSPPARASPPAAFGAAGCPAARPSASSAASPAYSTASFRMPFWAAQPHLSSATSTAALSHDAKPFLPQPRARIFDSMLAADIRSAADLHAAVRLAPSPPALFALISKHERLLDGCCVVAAMQRLQMLDPQLAPAADFRAVGLALAAQAAKLRHTMHADQLTSVLAGARTLGVPPCDALHKLAASAAALAPQASLDSLAALAALLAHTVERMPGGAGDPDALAAVAAALGARLASLRPAEAAALPPGLVPAIARALHGAKATPPAAVHALEAATLAALPALSAEHVVAMMSFFSDAKHTRPALFEALARAFDDKQAQWTPDAATAYLGLCRTHKHCERASRPLGILWAALAFLRPHVSRCDTRQLSSVVLDMAFIGIRGHDVLPAISAELTARLEAGAVITAHGPQLANVLHAFNKLGHRSEALSSVASGVLAASNLQARQMANVVATLAQQNLLSPAIIASASDLLQNRLHTCNGQDVSQILYGLMLDKHAARGAASVFASIAQPLAQALRSGAYDARAVSRIMSSFAKVGCYSPVVFDAGTKYLSSHMGTLQPAFLSELAWSLSVTDQAQPDVMKRIGSTIMRRLPDCNATMMCTTIWAFGHAGQFHADLFNAACGKLAHLVSRDQVNQQDVVQAMYGVTRSNFRHHRFLQAVHDWTLRWHAQIPVTTLPSVLWGLHALGHSSERLVREAAPRFAAQLSTFSPQDTSKLAQLAAAYAASGNVAQHAELFQAIEQRLTQPCARAVRFSPLDVSLLAGSFGASRCGASEKLVALLVGNGLEVMEEFTPSELARFTRGIAQIGYCSEELMSHVAATSLVLLPQTSVGDLAHVLCAFVEVQASAPALFESAAQTVLVKAAAGDISAAHAAQLCWAFAVHGTQAEHIISCLAAIIQDETASRHNEMYHMRRHGRALCQEELVQLMQVQALLSGVGPGAPHGLQLLDEQTRADAAAAFQEMVGDVRRSHVAVGGRRALQVTRDVLRDIARAVSSTPPASVAAFAGAQEGALAVADYWAEGRQGDPFAVVLLSPGHCMQAMRERPLGWVACMLAVLQRCVPRVVVVPWHMLPSLDHASVLKQIEPQLALA